MERFFQGGIENKIIFPDLEKRFREAEESLREYKIDMTLFYDLYGKEKVQEDILEVDAIKEKFLEEDTPSEKEAKKMAVIFESLFNKHGEQSNWLGENASIIPTSDYDDIVNGVDAIAEFSEEGKNPYHLGLGVDVTYSSHIKKKFEKIKKSIDKGKLSEIKYFHSTNMDFTGKLSQIPRVVISITRETLRELVNLNENKKNKELASHFVQFQMLDEILMQLEVFKEYAENVGQMKIAEKFEITKRIISEICENKKESVSDSGKRDRSLKLLEEQMKSVFY